LLPLTWATGVSVIVLLAATSVDCNGNEAEAAVVTRTIITMTLALKSSYMTISHDSQYLSNVMVHVGIYASLEAYPYDPRSNLKHITKIITQ